MKIILTGSLGNISKPLASKLIAAGHQVTVISSNIAKTADIQALGATAAIGSITDVPFLVSVFTGADAIYTMVPPNFAVPDLIQYFATIGAYYAEAIRQSGVTRVVNLSSVGAHLTSGNGAGLGAHHVENTLNALENVSVKHVRAPFFYTNFYNYIEMIRQQGFLGGNYDSNTRLIMVHPEDIAVATAEELLLQSTGVRYLASDSRTTGEIAGVLGTAIGKPSLQWVEFSNEQALQGMLQGGAPEVFAKLFVETGTAVRSGKLWEDYDLHKPVLGERKLETFAKEFAKEFAKRF
jgi:uncharacterized protein YbjT (DUF2867 family)